MFSNLNGVGPHLKGLVSKTIKQWSKVNMGSTSWMLLENPCSHSFEFKNISNLLQTRSSCMFDHVKDVFRREGLIKSLSLMSPSKSLMLKVNPELPNFYKILLMILKSSPTHHFKKVRTKRSYSSIQKDLPKIELSWIINWSTSKNPFFIWIQVYCLWTLNRTTFKHLNFNVSQIIITPLEDP